MSLVNNSVEEPIACYNCLQLHVTLCGYCSHIQHVIISSIFHLDNCSIGLIFKDSIFLVDSSHENQTIKISVSMVCNYVSITP